MNNKKEKFDPKNLDLIEYIKDLYKKDISDARDIDDECESCEY
jgi:hypothetical protein